MSLSFKKTLKRCFRSVFLSCIACYSCQKPVLTNVSIPQKYDPTLINIDGVLCTEDLSEDHFYYKTILLIDTTSDFSKKELQQHIQNFYQHTNTYMAFFTVGDHSFSVPEETPVQFLNGSEFNNNKDTVLSSIMQKQTAPFNLQEGIDNAFWLIVSDMTHTLSSVVSRTFYSIHTVRKTDIPTNDLSNIRLSLKDLSDFLLHKKALYFSYNETLFSYDFFENSMFLTGSQRGSSVVFNNNETPYYDFFKDNKKNSLHLSHFFIYNSSLIENTLSKETYKRIHQNTCPSYTEKEDNDHDYLTSCIENSIGTDPFSSDTDSDAVLDGVELGYGMDPLNSEDALYDFDGDGVSSLDETFQQTLPYEHDAFVSSVSYDFSPNKSMSTPTKTCYNIYVKNFPVPSSLKNNFVFNLYTAQKNSFFSNNTLIGWSQFDISIACLNKDIAQTCSRFPSEESYDISSLKILPTTP